MTVLIICEEKGVKKLSNLILIDYLVDERGSTDFKLNFKVSAFSLEHYTTMPSVTASQFGGAPCWKVE